MADQLPTVFGDSGAQEVVPVMVFGGNGQQGGGSVSAALTSIASSTASTALLAANTVRRGATIANTDANTLYVDLSGGVASSSSYSVAIASGGYYELPFGYTGAITGAWAADGAGAALVTEFS